MSSSRSFSEWLRSIPEGSWFIGFAAISIGIFLTNTMHQQPSSKEKPDKLPDHGHPVVGARTGSVPVKPTQHKNHTREQPQGDRPVSLNQLEEVLSGHEIGLFILDSEQASPRSLGHGDAPRLSPDGKKIAYITTDDTGLQQLFVRDLENDQTIQLTSNRGAKGHPS